MNAERQRSKTRRAWSFVAMHVDARKLRNDLAKEKTRRSCIGFFMPFQ
jgi:hypothetical protein